MGIKLEPSLYYPALNSHNVFSAEVLRAVENVYKPLEIKGFCGGCRLREWCTYLLIALLVVPLTIIYVYQDDLTVFSSWAFGAPRIMVKLEIRIPPVGVGFCGVVVRRLPTPYRPTKAGLSEEVYTGLHRPGDTVVVKELHAAIVAKAGIEKGEYKVEYYEPVEYIVLVLCKSKEKVYRYGRVHEVFPNRLVTTYTIEVKFDEEVSPGSRSSKAGSELQISEATGKRTESASTTTTISCEFYQSPRRGVVNVAECITWVKGPYLYSLPGLETAFGVREASAVYLEAYWDAVLCAPHCERNKPQYWSSAGRKLVFSVVAHETAPLSGRWRDRAYFNVRYRYEELYVSLNGFVKIGMRYWVLYPVNIGGVEMSGSLCQVLPWISCEKEYLNFIPPAPWYAGGPALGNKTISFPADPLRQKLYPTERTDEVLAGTYVNFTFPEGNWSATLTVHFYKAGRDDQKHTTLYVRVRDVSGSTMAWYYWWYRDNDPLTYEILFSNYR